MICRTSLQDIQNKDINEFITLIWMFKQLDHVEEDIQSILTSVLTEYNQDSMPDVFIYKHLFNYLSFFIKKTKYLCSVLLNRNQQQVFDLLTANENEQIQIMHRNLIRSLTKEEVISAPRMHAASF